MPRKANLCILLQARLAVEIPDNFMDMTPAERIEWGNDKLGELTVSRIILRQEENEDAMVSMIELHPEDDEDYQVVAMTRDWDVWSNLEEGRMIVPVFKKGGGK